MNACSAAVGASIHASVASIPRTIRAGTADAAGAAEKNPAVRISPQRSGVRNTCSMDTAPRNDGVVPVGRQVEAGLKSGACRLSDRAGYARRRHGRRGRVATGLGGSGAPARIAAGASVTIQRAYAPISRSAASTPSRSPVRLIATPCRSEASTCACRSCISAVARRRDRELRGPRRAPAVTCTSVPCSRQRREPAWIALQRRIAFRMRQQDPVAACRDAQHELLEVRRKLAVGRLDQEVVALAAVGGGRQGAIVRALGPREVDLAADDELDGDARLGARGAQLRRARGELGRPDRRVIRAYVRRGRERHDALTCGGRHRLDRLAHRGRPVVDARQHVGVEIDHAPRVASSVIASARLTHSSPPWRLSPRSAGWALASGSRRSTDSNPAARPRPL